MFQDEFIINSYQHKNVDKRSVNSSDRNASRMQDDSVLKHMPNFNFYDRNLFNGMSNTTDDSYLENNFTSTEYSKEFIGMPINNTVIYSNKKSLLSTPYIKDRDNMNNIIHDDVIQEIDPIEKDLFDFYCSNHKKSNKYITFISPFINSHIWKSLILLSKSPSTEQLLTVFNQPIHNKNAILSNMKIESKFLQELGTITINVPFKNQKNMESLNHINTALVNKLKDLYFLDVKYNERINHFIVYVNFLIEIHFPLQYDPVVIHNNLTNRKFIKLTNIPVYEQELENIVHLELNIGNNRYVGFIYDKNNSGSHPVNYQDIISIKQNNLFIQTLIIPQIKYSKKENMSKNYDFLDKIHLGELENGKYQKVDILIERKINMSTINVNIRTPKLPQIEIIEINNTFFYVKDSIEGHGTKIIACGVLNQ